MSDPPPSGTSELAWQATAGLAMLVAGFGVGSLAHAGIGPAFLLAMPAALLAAGAAVWHREQGLRQAEAREAERQRELDELYEAQAANARRLRRVEGIAELGLVAAQVGHELRNHLMSLDLNLDYTADLLRQQDDAITLDSTRAGQLRGAIADAMSATDRIRDITGDLRLLTRGGGNPTEPVAVDRAVELAVRMARPVIERSASLVVDIHRTRPAKGDLGRLSQAVLNLLLNSAQAIPQDTERRHFVGVRCWDERDGVAIVIEDNGCGIPLEDQEHIFETFWSTKRNDGTGLGLSFVRREVNSLGGQILVQSRPGEGTTFLIHLPAHTADALSAQKFRVLVVDGNALSARATASHLRSRYDVSVARSAAEARSMLEEDSFDVLLCEADEAELYEHLEADAPQYADRMVFMSDGDTPCPREPVAKDPRALFRAVEERTRG